MAGPDLDVVVVGDGPAGLALGAACRRAGLSTLVCGLGAPWTATYGTWRDDVADVPDRCFAVVAPRVVVHGHRRHVIERPYGVFDNGALRAHLAAGLDVRVREGLWARHFDWGSRLLVDGGEFDARLVVEATGFPPMLARASPPAAHQTAFGVVVGERPPAYADDDVVLMDLRPVDAETPTFCYVVPAGAAWLVEETSLAARPSAAPDRLRELLGVRVGADVVGTATRREVVSIPMGGRLPDRTPARRGIRRGGQAHPPGDGLLGGGVTARGAACRGGDRRRR